MYPILEVKNFITPEEATELIQFINTLNFNQGITKSDPICQKIQKKISDLIDIGKFPSHYLGKKFVKLGNDVTISKHTAPFAIDTHIDQKRDTDGLENLTKFLIYLNEDETGDFESGGTVFYNDDDSDPIVVKREQYKAALFDIRQRHKGNTLKSGIKYLIGFRLLYA